MERSRELRGLVYAIYRDWAAGDPSSLDILSDGDDVTGFGTDARENLRGPEVIAVFKQQLTELTEVGPIEIEPGEVMALVNGNVGWVVDTPTFRLGGNEFTPRSTMIFEREGMEWRCVHWHISLGQSNEDVLGVELTTTIEEIADWAEGAKPDLTAFLSTQGTVTIVFTDIESSTATNEEMGDDRFVPLLLEHNEIVTARTKDCDGMVVKSQGDGFMLAFPSAKRAVQCLIAVQQAVTRLEGAIRVRMGVHTGEPTRHADDFFGRDVAYAARLGAAARGGEILVSGLVKSLVEPGGTIAFDGPRELDLRGFDGPQPAYSVVWSG